MYRHESFLLWESKLNKCLLHGTNDFVALNRDGIRKSKQLQAFVCGSSLKDQFCPETVQDASFYPPL